MNFVMRRYINKILFLVTIFFFYSAYSFSQDKLLSREFPLSSPFEGIQIGNGTQGLMIWGRNNQLNITIGHNGFWDHRGYNDLAYLGTFRELKDMLYASDTIDYANEIKAKFRKSKEGASPQLHGGGRLEILFPAGYKLQKGLLNINSATAEIHLIDNKGTRIAIAVQQVMQYHDKVQLALLNLPAGIEFSCNLIPAWEWNKEEMQKRGIKSPENWSNGKGIKGFIQELPEDQPLGIAYQKTNNNIILGSYLGASPQKKLSDQLLIDTVKRYIPSTRKWWKEYWADVPRISLPDPILQAIVDNGLYQQACVTNPLAEAAGLQGPFLESYQLPPWGGDFHFNINVQMIYSPVLPSNRPGHNAPLWAKLDNWLPGFKQKGEQFYEQKGAILFPHATDDRGHVRGSFWTGIIDQSCAAWTGFMVWKDYLYTQNKEVLSKTAWPLLAGAFEAYWATLEKIHDSKERDGYKFSLPVSFSAEYGRSYFAYQQAWGRDASFQLAALHRVLRILPKAAKILGKPIDSRWEDVERHLPPYTLINTIWMPEDRKKGSRIALWENQGLDASHRHHSHLAGIYPFCTIDPGNKDVQSVLYGTINDWLLKGAGNWMGWSCPWASEIWSRLGNPDAAISWLHYWVQNYVSKGGFSMAFVNHPGQSIIADYHWPKEGPVVYPSNEKMQMDGAMSALNAVFELLVQNDFDSEVISVLPAIPGGWINFNFDGIRTIGAFLVSATVQDGKTRSIEIKSTKGGLLKLKHGMGEKISVNGKPFSSKVFEKKTLPGEVLILTKD